MKIKIGIKPEDALTKNRNLELEKIVTSSLTENKFEITFDFIKKELSKKDVIITDGMISQFCKKKKYEVLLK